MQGQARAVLSAIRRRLGVLSGRRPRAAAGPPTSGSLAGRVSFAVGTGRCGTHFIARLVEEEPEVAAVHERDPLLQAFHRYCKWYDLPVDDEGFLQAMEAEIRRDLARYRYSFESSPTLALSITELDARFAPKFVLLVRNPFDVVKSYLHKGWYAAPIVQKRPDLALGYQRSRRFQHFLGRVVPRGEQFEAWNRLSRVGKLAWYWAALNAAVLRKAEHIPPDRWRVYRIEEFDYARYLEFAAYIGFTPHLTKKTFDRIRASRPGAQRRMPPAVWSRQEWREFTEQVAPLAERFGYPAGPASP